MHQLCSFQQLWAFLDNQYVDTEVRVRALNKLQILKQGTQNFQNFIDEFNQLILEAEGSLDDEIRRSLCEKALNSHLTIAALSIDGTGTFEAYKTRLTAMDDRIVRYNANHKGFPFGTSSKSETMSPIVEPVEEDIMDWEVAVATSQQTQKKFQDTSRKGRAKWVSKEEVSKRYEEKRCIRCGASGHFAKACPHLPAKRPVQAAAVIKKNGATSNQQPRVEELEDSEGSEN